MSASRGPNVGVRRFPSVPPLGYSLRRSRGRVGIAGSPHVAVDRLAKGLILASTFLLATCALLFSGLEALPLLAVGTPAGLGLAFLIAGMGGVTWARLTAVLYCGVFLVLVGLLLGQTT